MKNLTKKVLFCAGLFAFIFVGGGVFAQDNEEEDLRERLDMLIERANEIIEIAEELEEAGELPLTPEEECDKYLTTYIKYGEDNDSQEVEELQIFLNEHMGEDIPVTGFYGEITMNAVKDFQEEYASEILEPWGINEPTGYVYKTTQRKINDLNCPETTIPMPELIPDTGSYQTEEEEGEDEQAGETTNNMTAQVVENNGETEEGEDEEETEETEEGEEGEEDEEAEGAILDADLGGAGRGGDGRSVAWVILVLASIGLGATLYYIYGGKQVNQNA